MIIGAGTEATGAALSITTFYLLASPSKTLRLQEELASLQPSDPSDASALLTYPQLRGLPYLSACISEGLRLSKESNRMPRIINSASTMHYNGLPIPAGTVVSMSLRDIHLDASIYDSPRAFMPERWLLDRRLHAKGKLDRFFVPFGKGSRGCVGRKLAMVELYVAIGNLFRGVGFGMELWDTSEEDIRRTHDFFSLEGGCEGRGLRVVRR